MNPLLFLWLLVGVTAFAAAVHWAAAARQAGKLRRLAGELGMTFMCQDRFRLAARIGSQLPLPGAADVTARNLMYQVTAGRRRYLFTVEYTQGAVASQRRRRRVAGADEPAGGGEAELTVRLAPDDLPLMEQYRRLHEKPV